MHPPRSQDRCGSVTLRLNQHRHLLSLRGPRRRRVKPECTLKARTIDDAFGDGRLLCVEAAETLMTIDSGWLSPCRERVNRMLVPHPLHTNATDTKEPKLLPH